MRPKQNILMKDHLYHNIIWGLAFRGSHSPFSVLISFNSSVSPAVTLYPMWICHHDRTICALHIFAYISTNTLCLHFYLLTPSIYISTYTLCLHFYLYTQHLYLPLPASSSLLPRCASSWVPSPQYLQFQITVYAQLHNEHCSHAWPHTVDLCWKTTPMKDNPGEGPPWWETTWWETTPMKDHPDERPPDERPPRWKITLMRDHLIRDHPDVR